MAFWRDVINPTNPEVFNNFPHPMDLPKWFKKYEWNYYHFVFGKKPDTFENGFPWIVELENKFRPLISEHLISRKLIRQYYQFLLVFKHKNLISMVHYYVLVYELFLFYAMESGVLNL